MKTRSFVASALAAAVAGLPAVAAQIAADNPQSIVDALTVAGYRAELKTDDLGDPLVLSSAAGAGFPIAVHGRTNGAACTSVAFQTGHDLEGGTTPAAVNRRNAENRYAKAHLDDENDPCLEMDINLEAGGMADALFMANVRLWEESTGAFQTHIGW